MCQALKYGILLWTPLNDVACISFYPSVPEYVIVLQLCIIFIHQQRGALRDTLKHTRVTRELQGAYRFVSRTLYGALVQVVRLLINVDLKIYVRCSQKLSIRVIHNLLFSFKQLLGPSAEHIIYKKM